MRLAFAETLSGKMLTLKLKKRCGNAAGYLKNWELGVSSIEIFEAGQARQLNAEGLIIAAEAYTLNRRWLEEYFDRLDPIVAQRMIKGEDVEASEYLQNNITWRNLRAKAVDSLREVDALLVPTTAIPALPTAEVDADTETYSERNVGYLRHCHRQCFEYVRF